MLTIREQHLTANYTSNNQIGCANRAERILVYNR
jgi:hypothetical protein